MCVSLLSQSDIQPSEQAHTHTPICTQCFTLSEDRELSQIKKKKVNMPELY